MQVNKWELYLLPLNINACVSPMDESSPIEFSHVVICIPIHGTLTPLESNMGGHMSEPEKTEKHFTTLVLISHRIVSS